MLCALRLGKDRGVQTSLNTLQCVMPLARTALVYISQESRSFPSMNYIPSVPPLSIGRCNQCSG